jgi:hypothetical protein
VVGNGAGIHTAFFGFRYHAGNSRKTVQQAVFAMIVQMDKLTHASSKPENILEVIISQFSPIINQSTDFSFSHKIDHIELFPCANRKGRKKVDENISIKIKS